MNAGELNNRISIYKLGTKTNDMNEESPAPQLLKKVWAKIEPRTGSLLSGRPAETMLSKTTHAIKVRTGAAKGITPDCYIEWVDKEGCRHRFDIEYILPPVRMNPTTYIYVREMV